MRFQRAIFLLAALLLTVSGCSLFGPPKPVTPKDPVSAVISGSQQLHDQVRRALQQAAEQINLPIQIDTFLFASRDDFVVASALVNPFDEIIYIDEFNRTADLGVIFLSLPPRANVPVGFFKVRAFITQSRVELLDSAGQPVITLPLERLGYITGSSKPMIQVTGCEVTLPYNQIHQEGGRQTIQVAVRLSWCERLIR